LSLVAGYAAPYDPPRKSEAERHVEAQRPSELVGMDCFFVGRLQGTRGSVWQLTAIDVASSYAWAELVTCPRGQPTGEQTSKLARQVAAELAGAGRRLERVLTDNGGEFRSTDFRATLNQLGAAHTYLGGRYAPHENWGFGRYEREFLDILRAHRVRLVCCAHGLAFDEHVHDGIRFVMSGGGGTGLCSHMRGICTEGDGSPEDRGALVHFVEVSVAADGSISGRVVQAFADPATSRYRFGD
jgi:hypothetical protein